MVQRVLCIILAASRPLSVSELNTAMNVSYDSKSIANLDLEEEVDFLETGAVFSIPSITARLIFCTKLLANSFLQIPILTQQFYPNWPGITRLQ